jgi:hypothetical protein
MLAYELRGHSQQLFRGSLGHVKVAYALGDRFEQLCGAFVGHGPFHLSSSVTVTVIARTFTNTCLPIRR